MGKTSCVTVKLSSKGVSKAREQGKARHRSGMEPKRARRHKAASGTRAHNLLLTKRMLYQLSHMDPGKQARQVHPYIQKAPQTEGFGWKYVEEPSC